ncbi:cytochrome P450 71D7-like [Salvia hispanica]|uniref:cytochrome P450 71D7-like n=1 Tax=Salvia hispanica TaxID=49212 RepID=UPI0020096548|nr:cytochrome P450 71D7-like [Salvia hispanica]
MAGLITTAAALILSAIFVFMFNYQKKYRNRKSIKLPPGPRKLPIIGNLHQISNPLFRCFRDLSNQYGPIMHLKVCESKGVVVSSPDLVKQILKDLDHVFADRRQHAFSDILMYGPSDIVFGPTGGYWRQMRKLCINELLSLKMVQLFQSIRSDETSRLIDSLRESSGRVVNFTEKIFFHSSSVTCRAAYGSVCEDSETLIKLTADASALASGFEIADLFPSWRIVGALSWTKRRFMAMRRELDVILDDVIERHKRNRVESEGGGGRRLGNSEFGSEDLVDVFLRVQEEGQLEFPIDNDNIKAVLFDLFVAGTDTSAGTIDWTITELLRHPQVMAKAQAEVRQALKGNSTQQSDIVHNLKYLKLVIKETMRLHPAFPMVSRASKEEQMINGYTIPAGEWVIVNIWGMHRDPRYWKDQEMFKPERFEDQSLDFVDGDCHFLPFGAGKRMCPGITFGLTNVEFTLAQLLYNFDWGLPEGVRAEDLDMTENDALTAPRKQNLSVVVSPYN